MSNLVRVNAQQLLDELEYLGLHDPGRVPEDFAVYRHPADRSNPRELTVIFNVETYDIDQAAFYHFGIRRWRHVSVSVVGQLHARLADQKAIGRKRGPGERSPAPLPDWYDLTHVAYGHWGDFGFIPDQPVFQSLPPPSVGEDGYLNIAEALHLRQPA